MVPYKDRERQQEHARKYFQEHKEAFRVYHARSYTKNKQAVLARQKSRYHRDIKAGRERSKLKARIYRQRHPEKVAANPKRHQQENPDWGQAAAAKRRAQYRNAPVNDFSLAQWREMKEAYGSRCVYCLRKMERLTMDHLTPISKGGSHTASNIVPACLSCNSSKHDGDVLRAVQPLFLTLAERKAV